jgi:hypothetical protein
VDTNSRRRRENATMMIFIIWYTQAQYLTCDAHSLVVAEDFNDAIEKWEKKFVDQPNIRMTGIKIHWEFPVI